MRRRCFLLWLAVVACGTPAGDGNGPPDSAESASSTTPPAIVESSSSTSAITPTTSASSSTTDASPPPGETVTPLPSLADGRPSSFMAVTDDYAAVEVDTASGQILRTLGQVADREELENAECAACVNVIDAVWRAVDGSRFYVSECCEPAAGAVYALTPGERITAATATSFEAWTVTPSPTTRQFIALGYQIGLGSGGELTDILMSDDGDLGSSTAAWLGPTEIGWLDRDETGRWHLIRLDLGATSPAVIPLPWARDNDFLPDLTVQASGNLVTFRQVGIDTTANVEGVVFTPDGELVATFPVEDGSRLGGYDPSGRFLIYVDGDGTARWQGLGGGGTLGEGFVFASW